MPEAIIALGSNVGDRLTYLKKALNSIQWRGTILKISPLYETSPYGFVDQPYFLNAVLLMETHLSAEQLLSELKHIEEEVGRKQRIRWGPREIDLDIIFYNHLQLESEDLTIPHADFQNRRFVLQPLADIAPDWQIPGSAQTVQQFLNICPDKTIIKLIEKDWYI